MRNSLSRSVEWLEQVLNLRALALVLVAVVLSAGAAAQTSAPAASEVKISEFVEQDFPLPTTIEARQRPADDAPVLARLRQGMSLRIKGIVDGNNWLQVALPDGRVGYVHASDIPAVLTSTAPTPGAPTQSGAAVTATGAAPPPPAAAPSAVESAAPPPDQAANQNTESTATAELPPLIQFSPVDQAMKVGHDTSVFVAPNRDAPQIYGVHAGVVVEVVAVSNDKAWAWVATENSDPAYIAMTDLTPATPEEIQAVVAEFPPTISGRATVAATTSALRIGDRELDLYGLEGLGPPFTQQLQALIDRLGRTLACERKGSEYVCQTSSKHDIAEEALRSGIARPDASASPDYVKAAEEARTAKRGTWAN